MKRKIVLIGAGGHAKSCINLIEKINNFKIIGLTDNKKKGYLLNYKILGDDSILDQKKFRNINLCLSFGSIFNIKLREKIFKKLKFYPNKRLLNAKLLGETSVVFPINPNRALTKIRLEIDVIKKILNKYL